MAIYKFTSRAEEDLGGIVDYTLTHWGADQAVRYLDGLEMLAATLAGSPDLGRCRDDLHKGLIVFPYQRHLLFYWKEPHGITIVRILHEGMDAPSRWTS